MAQPIADRVKDATTTTGVGSVTLSNTAPSGYVTFLTGFGASTSRQICYCISDSANGRWEVGLGTYTSATNLLTRNKVLSNYLGTTAKASFLAGTKDVFCTTPSASLLAQDNQGYIDIGNINQSNGVYFRTSANNGFVPNTLGISCSIPTNSGDTGTILSFQAGSSAAAGDGDGGYVSVQAGNAANAGAGGQIILRSGDSATGLGGTNSLSAGTGPAGGGPITIYAGSSTLNAGGLVDIASGDGGSTGTGSGGQVRLLGGTAGGGTSGGNIEIIGGGVQAGSNANGGGINLRTGSATGTGTSGSFTVKIGGNATPALNIAPSTASSDDPKIGFFGATPVVKPTGVAVTAAGIHAALVSLGLIAA